MIAVILFYMRAFFLPCFVFRLRFVFYLGTAEIRVRL